MLNLFYLTINPIYSKGIGLEYTASDAKGGEIKSLRRMLD